MSKRSAVNVDDAWNKYEKKKNMRSGVRVSCWHSAETTKSYKIFCVKVWNIVLTYARRYYELNDGLKRAKKRRVIFER